MPTAVTKVKRPKITKAMIGHYVRIYYTDIGCTDGICVDVDLESKYKSFKVFRDGYVNAWVQPDQLVSIGPPVECPEF